MAAGAPGEMIESSLGPKYQCYLSQIMLLRRISILDMGEIRLMNFSERPCKRLKLKMPDYNRTSDKSSFALVQEAVKHY